MSTEAERLHALVEATARPRWLAYVMCCANCGIAGVDEIKLEECHGCDLVKYCSDKCREEHREQHQQECKRRANELHDKRLFTQPDRTHKGECPICFLPMPLDESKHCFSPCCGQWICMGCAYAHLMNNIQNKKNAHGMCVFCRTLTSDKDELRKRKKERIEANDPPSLCFMGHECYEEGDYDKALEYFTKAAELGDAAAQYYLGRMYMEGKGVEKDNEKAVYHLEKAAIGGHPYARHNLAFIETEDDKDENTERAVKHLIIAANLGHECTMKQLLTLYKEGVVTKEEYGATLRTHQAAIDATKSSQRDQVETFLAKMGL